MNESGRTQDQLRRLAAGEAIARQPALEGILTEAGLSYTTTDHDELVLDKPLELLDHDTILSQLSGETAALVSNLEIHWSIDSTNTWMLKNDHRDDWHGLICLAEQQLAGKGRRGRRWVSPFGKNIYMSAGWGMPRDMSGLSGLSLVAGIQVVRALRALGLQDTWLKWPNDIVMGQGKVAGILVELTAPKKDRVGIVMGLGVNLRLDPRDAAGIDQRWSAIGEQQEVSRNALVASILNNLLPALNRFESAGFGVWQEEWDACDVFRGRTVVVHVGENKVSGINKGIDAEGNLLIETDQGMETFSAGEVSLREAR